MIRLQGASVRRGGRMLVQDIDLEIGAGRVTVLIGPNGAGKSTLIRLLSGEVKPSAGTVSLDGRPLAAFSPRELAMRRAVLGQANETTFGFSVADLAGLSLRLLPTRLIRAERTALIARALDRVGLTAFADRSIVHLSGGEKQRAHLARVLVQLWASEALHGPGLLLLDEPIAAQDLAHQLELLQVARRHAQAGGTVVLVLHDLNWAAGVADRILALRQGRIHADGPPPAVLTRALLAEVFDIDLEPGAVPAPGEPFILPQLARARRP